MTETDLSTQNSIPVKASSNTRWKLRAFANSPIRVALAYLGALTVAEAMTTLIEPLVGMILHAVLLVLILLHASMWSNALQQRFLMCLILAPLIRLMSLSMPLSDYPLMFWYMIVGGPLILAAFVAARTAKMSRQMVGLVPGKWPIQLLIGFSGVGLGYVEYVILRPNALISELTLAQAWLPALILLIFTGFLEELIFRGMLQYASLRSFGKLGLVYSAVVFAVLHLGYNSALDLVFVLSVALFWGVLALRTRSILGVTIAHGLTNIGLFLIFPFLVAAPTVKAGDIVPTPAVSVPGLLAPVPTPMANSTDTPTLTPFAPIENQVNRIPTASSFTATITNVRITEGKSTLTNTVTSTITRTVPLSTPSATPCQPDTRWAIYVVQPGDTLFSISVRANISLEELRLGNCLITNLIYSGGNLYVPTGILPVATVTPTRTSTSTPVVKPSATRTNTPLVPSPTSTFTATSIPPTEAPTFTDTAVPATESPISPTETSVVSDTQVPPTETLTFGNTPVQPTNTPTLTDTPGPPTETSAAMLYP